jgi:hypothetical protein
MIDTICDRIAVDAFGDELRSIWVRGAELTFAPFRLYNSDRLIITGRRKT